VEYSDLCGIKSHRNQANVCETASWVAGFCPLCRVMRIAHMAYYAND
jgi:hypothetical protein